MGFDLGNFVQCYFIFSHNLWWSLWKIEGQMKYLQFIENIVELKYLAVDYMKCCIWYSGTLLYYNSSIYCTSFTSLMWCRMLQLLCLLNFCFKYSSYTSTACLFCIINYHVSLFFLSCLRSTGELHKILLLTQETLG